MNRYFIYAALAIIALVYCLGLTCGHSIKKCSPCPDKKCPEIVNTTDTIVLHDTIKKYISRKEFKIVTDTVKDTVFGQAIQYSENCITMEDSSNGAYAKMTMCSKELPKYKPLDLHGSLELSLPADTQRTYRYVDTIKVVPKSKWIVLTLGPYAGYGFSGADAGIGISLGLKLKEW